MSHKELVVVITGASSGIGRATALRFAHQKACLVLASRRDEALQQLVDECVALGAQAISLQTDVTNAVALEALAETSVENFGRIDVWVNCAAVSLFGRFSEVPLEDFRRVIDVNVMGYVHGARAALGVMTEQRRGVIINVASIVGEVPQPYTAAYGMSKAAVRALGVSLRQEFALQKLKGIKVVTVSPPTVDTPFFRHAANYTGRAVLAMPPVYSVDRVAKAIVDAAKRPRPEVVVGASGSALVKQHRRHPVAVEAQMAMQVEKTHLSRTEPAEDGSGNLYEPGVTSDATATGGWHGRAHSNKRWLVAALLLGGGVIIVTRSEGARRLATTLAASAVVSKLPLGHLVLVASALSKLAGTQTEDGSGADDGAGRRTILSSRSSDVAGSRSGKAARNKKQSSSAQAGRRSTADMKRSAAESKALSKKAQRNWLRIARSLEKSSKGQ
jgi:short-subunit dehydrogenase